MAPDEAEHLPSPQGMMGVPGFTGADGIPVSLPLRPNHHGDTLPCVCVCLCVCV